MKITRRQLRQIILEACGCGSSPEPEVQNYIDETELSTRFADEASAKTAALTSTVTLADALEMSGVDINDQLLSRIYVAILDVMRDEQRGTHDDIDDEVEAPSIEDAFYPGEVEAREDAWSGGDNIEDPLDHADFETGESNTGPHVRTGGCGMREAKITRRQLRKIIKEEVSSLVEEDTETDWANTLPTGIVKYDGGKKKRTDVEAIQKALKALAKLKHTSDPGTVDGRYGNNTVNSIKAFQRKASDVKVDGDYGPQTRKAMVDLLKKAPEEKSDQPKKEELETEDETKKEKAAPEGKSEKSEISFNLVTKLGGRKIAIKKFDTGVKIMRQTTSMLAKRVKSIYGIDISDVKIEVHEEKHGKAPDPHFLVKIYVSVPKGGGGDAQDIAAQCAAIITGLLKTSVDTNFKYTPSVEVWDEKHNHYH